MAEEEVVGLGMVQDRVMVQAPGMARQVGLPVEYMLAVADLGFKVRVCLVKKIQCKIWYCPIYNLVIYLYYSSTIHFICKNP